MGYGTTQLRPCCNSPLGTSAISISVVTALTMLPVFQTSAAFSPAPFGPLQLVCNRPQSNTSLRRDRLVAEVAHDGRPSDVARVH